MKIKLSNWNRIKSKEILSIWKYFYTTENNIIKLNIKLSNWKKYFSIFENNIIKLKIMLLNWKKYYQFENNSILMKILL